VATPQNISLLLDVMMPHTIWMKQHVVMCFIALCILGAYGSWSALQAERQKEGQEPE
jgi:hypothetical protein